MFVYQCLPGGNSLIASDGCNFWWTPTNYAEVFHTSAEREVVRQIKEKAPRELGGDFRWTGKSTYC